MATHNPLYITDHRDGGYGFKTDYEKEQETFYATAYVTFNSGINGFLLFFVIGFQTVFSFLRIHYICIKDCVRLSVETHHHTVKYSTGGPPLMQFSIPRIPLL